MARGEMIYGEVGMPAFSSRLRLGYICDSYSSFERYTLEEMVRKILSKFK